MTDSGVGARWRTLAGLDFHILATLLFRGWSILAGALTVLLVPMWLDPAEQGYYYTFASVLALQIFFELGLNQVLVQLVSHEVAHLEVAPDGHIVGQPSHLNRLGALVRLTRRWYLVAALLFFCLAGIAGAYFFMRQGTQPVTQWLGIWAVLVAATALNLWFSPRLAMLEGCGRVGQVARLRLMQSVVGYALLWALLFTGAGLWAAVALPLATAACTACWLNRHGTILRGIVRRTADGAQHIRWRTDVLPLQWRIALSWVSGYFIFNLFTPLIFAQQGAVEAGRLGMALTVFSSVSAIGMSWVNAKTPDFTMHIARGERRELNTLFRAVASRCVAFTAVLSLLIVLTVWLLSHLGLPGMSRIASLGVLSGLALVTVANSAVFAGAAYMRAHREEPMLPVSVATAALTALGAYFGSRMGTQSMVFLYAIVTVFVALPWTAGLFLKYFKRTA